MIRRDYLLRMIEEFVAALSRIRSLKKGRKWDEAAGELDQELKELVGEGAESVGRLSETDLLAKLMAGGPTQALRDKTFILSTLLVEAGDVAIGKEQIEAGRECYLKALHLLLDVLGRDDVFECPEFVPKVEWLREMLSDAPLPLRTLAMLMQHYERSGEFAKAEDMLYAMREAEPGNKTIADFGINFYQRLIAQSDAALDNGNLPRAEVEAGLRELQTTAK